MSKSLISASLSARDLLEICLRKYLIVGKKGNLQMTGKPFYGVPNNVREKYNK